MPSAAARLGSQRGPSVRNIAKAKRADITTVVTDQAPWAGTLTGRMEAVRRRAAMVDVFAQASGSAGGGVLQGGACYGYSPSKGGGGPGVAGAYAYLLNVPVPDFAQLKVTLGDRGLNTNYIPIPNGSSQQQRGANEGGGSGGARHSINYYGGSGGGRALPTYIKGLPGGDVVVPPGGAGGGGGYQRKRGASYVPGGVGQPPSVPAAGQVRSGSSGSGGSFSGEGCYGWGGAASGGPAVTYTTNPAANYVMPVTRHPSNDWGTYQTPPSPTNAPWGTVDGNSPGAGGPGTGAIPSPYTGFNQYDPATWTTGPGRLGRVTIVVKLKL